MLTAIFDNSGKKVAGDTELFDELPESVLTAELPLNDGEYYFSRLSDGSISVICDDKAVIEAINSSKPAYKRITKNDFLKKLISGIKSNEIIKLCTRFSFKFDETRRVYVVNVANEKQVDIAVLEEVFDSETMSIADIGGNIVFICDDSDADAKETAAAINATFCELSTDCSIGVSCKCDNADGLHDAYEQALLVLKTGRSTSFTENIWFFSESLPEILLASGLGENLREIKKKAEQINKCLDSETIELIGHFFRNSLNISETARLCYLHRNTLIYRLDKIQKDTGFDLRVFDEAVALRLLLAANKYLN